MKMNNKPAVFTCLLMIFTVVCGQYALAQEAVDPAAVPSGTYQLDKSHGYLVFSYSHFGFSNPLLRFTGLDSTITYDNGDISNSKATMTIAVDSIDSGVAMLNDELVGENFFNAEKFPQISFVSTSYKSTGAATAKLTGDLTIKGITKPVTLDVTLNRAAEHPMSKKSMLGFSASGTLVRSEFDVGRFAPMVGDEVSFRFEAEFVKAD